MISSSSSFFPKDAMSFVSDFILLKNLAMVEEPFYVVARAMRMLMMCPQDYDAVILWMAL